MKKRAIPLSFLIFFSSRVTHAITPTITQVDEQIYSIEVPLNSTGDNMIYHDLITVSSDHPDVQLGQWKTSTPPKNNFDPHFKETKKVYDVPTNLIIPATIKKHPVHNAQLHITYLTSKNQQMQTQMVPITYAYKTETENAVEATCQKKCQRPAIPAAPKKSSWADYLQKIITSTQSLWIRMLLVFLLGILMSLTPCIYPMIPITVGILQSQKRTSVFYNFALALTYTFGIATTFAVCGLLAALTGSVCGKILMNPLFVLLLVALLTYLAFSMFDLYQMYSPQFLRSNNSLSSTGSSFISAFLFGAASGTVASPCLSPGLALLISIVATLGSKLLGFVLLFAFGVGLGIPLLIIGTFSGSLNKLPKAGAWMIEVKKIFGFLLFGMCFYYLNNIFPWYIILWLLTLFTLACGIYYLRDAEKTAGSLIKNIKNIVGISLVALSVEIAFWAYQATYQTTAQEACAIEANWQIDYQQALTCAQGTNKKLFIDFWATFCSICKAIDKKLFQDQQVMKFLNDKLVPLKVDGSDETREPFATLQKNYSILGFPTYLLINPKDGKIIKKWGSELYGMSKEQFMQEIQRYVA